MAPRILPEMFRVRRVRDPLLLVIGCVIIVLLAHLFEWVHARQLENDWRTVRDKTGQEHLAAAERAFGDEQRVARRLAVEIGQQNEVLHYLSGRSTDRRPVFAATTRAAQSAGVGIELYDHLGELAAWAGQGGSSGRREVLIALAGQMTSFVSKSAVSSQLFLAVPIRHEARVIGAVVVRQTIEVASPLRNRFIGRAGVADQLTADLGVPVHFIFPPDAAPEPDSLWITAPLYGIDSTRVGSVQVWRLSRTELEELRAVRYDDIHHVLAALLLLVIVVPLVRAGHERFTGLPRLLIVTALLWGLRYGLLWLDVPNRLFSEGIFDPKLFASTFGGGLARSIGDLTLTVATFAGNLMLVVYPGSTRPLRPRMRKWSFAARGAGAIILAVVPFLLLRGFAAVVRSMLYDSSMTIGDPAVLFPPIPMALLLLNATVLACALAAVAAEIAGTVVHMVGWRWAMALTVLAALGVGLYGDPLVSAPFRIVFGACALFLWWLSAGEPGPPRLPTLAMKALGVAVFSAIILFPLLDAQLRERDRSKVETFAIEVLRPVDGWLKFIVEEGLQQVIAAAETEETARGRESVALRAWAQSAACREGYSSVFELLDAEGGEVSRFAIGGQTGVAHQVSFSVPLDTQGVLRVKSIGDGVSAVRVYSGSAPVRNASGKSLGHVRVTVAAGEEQLFRGDNPSVLRGSSRETLESFYRPITITEYRDGLYLRSTNKAFPFTHVLADELTESLPMQSPPTVWSDETISGVTYETFYAVRGEGGRGIIGLSLERQNILLRLVGLVKVGLLYVLLLMLWGGSLLLRAWLRGRKLRFSFRDRLLATMLSAALLPLAILLIYSQLDVRKRMMESMALRLDDQTAGIAQDIAGIGEHADASSELEVRPDRVELIASNAGTDFNLYVGTMLRISSRPELYTAGLLDSRISGSAYAEVVLGGKWFHVETEHIGLFRYAVGYRPVLDAAGGIIGVVSLPTLFRQDELERELVGRHAVLFGVYAVVLLAMLIITPVLAHRFASPVLQLTAIARDVGKGDLHISERLPRADGEIGELVQSFDTMTRELERSRDTLVQVERELAWKEMARQVAHEIKNPLTPMKLSVQHLRRAYLDHAQNFGEILEQVTQTVIGQIEALSRIASEFSTFARMPRRTLASCAPGDIVSEAVQLFRQDSRVEFDLKIDPALPMIQADREELRRGCINILRNGVQAMSGEGRMDIRVSRSLLGVQITFRDFGPGIPDEIKPKLFQPNFSTKTDGMGLGLAIVKKTVTDMGGKVSIDSAVGEGTTVTLDVPAKEADS
jgi:two-component system nitrogen regulation sensor histidine kinase NtrY